MEAEWDRTFGRQGSLRSNEESEPATSDLNADSAREVLAKVRERIESTEAAGDAVEAVTAEATVAAYLRSESLIDAFVAAEIDATSDGDRAARGSRPPRFGEAFRKEIERTEAELGEGYGRSGAGIAIRTAMAYGFAACAIRQRQLREDRQGGLEPDPDLDSRDVRRVWLERVNSEYETLRQDPIVGPWCGQICSPGFDFFVRGAGLLGIVDARHSRETVEALTDDAMVSARMLDVGDVYAGAETVTPFVAFYTAAGWALYLANTPSWYSTPRRPGADVPEVDQVAEQREAPDGEDPVESELSIAPAIIDASPIGVYRLGSFNATLLGNVESKGPIGYRWVLLVERDERPRLFVSAEIMQEVGTEPVEEPHDRCFLGVFGPQGHGNLGDDEDWTMISNFLPRALEIAADELAVNEPPQREWGVPLPNDWR